VDIPKDWTFKNKGVAENFDAHVSEQLPWYNMTLGFIAHIARAYLTDGSTLVDLGCATGAVTRSLADTIAARGINARSFDNSQEMIDNFKGVGSVSLLDASKVDEIPKFDVCVCYLVLMFLPIADRQRILDGLKARCNQGGIIVFVDKVEPFSGYFGTVINRLSMLNKLTAGVCADDILTKELSLSGFQRPSAEALYIENGFFKWFQIGDFCGYAYENS